MSDLVLSAVDIVREFPRSRTAWFRARPTPFRAVDGVSLTVSRGRTLGIVGESGCGKSTMARMMVGLLEPTSGKLTVDGKSIADLARRDRRALYRRVQMVFQDPLGSLNPRKTVREILSAPLIALKGMTGQQAHERVAELMDLVSLRPDFADRYPHEFSGGQSQRIGIARALAAEPAVIVLDEPVSALDVSVQAQVLQLLGDLQSRLGLTYVFISHDLAVVEAIAHDVAVMNLGRIVESAPAERIFADPQHAYTRLLLASVPRAAAA
ncbi:ATP-binding cassette domain-containing protein [Lichenihabitans psoromatis]|uniref:ATP-binding cassette domain-containing protein n=1 Tax=Lichenihabitans psoromatis TaxID=2528642 RepID=UPI0010364599|nr:ATP-binding cassette domain-containing protein [Lichenihabitans psoromatis]